MMKLGLALGGGAFRGMAHIGVLQALQEGGIAVDCVSGTSIGAFIGGVYACGVSPYMLEKLAVALNMRDYYDMGIPREGFIKGDRLLAMIRTLTGNRDFSQTRIPFRAVATDIRAGERVTLSDGKLCDAIRASVSLPGIFVPHKIGDRVLVDGGLLDRVPVAAAREMGADVVVAVDVGYKGSAQPPEGILEILAHAFEIMDWELTRVTVQTAEVLISPDLHHIDYSSIADAAQSIQLGRQACEGALPAIREAITAKVRELDGGEKRRLR